MSLVLDNSVTMRWCFGAGQPNDVAYADRVMDVLLASAVHVPAIWQLGVTNVLVRAELHGLISDNHTSAFIGNLRQLRLIVDGEARAFDDTLQLARRYHLSAYDAAYLELALRKRLPLATLDAGLRKAAKRAGVTIF